MWSGITKFQHALMDLTQVILVNFKCDHLKCFQVLQKYSQEVKSPPVENFWTKLCSSSRFKMKKGYFSLILHMSNMGQQGHSALMAIIPSSRLMKTPSQPGLWESLRQHTRWLD